MLTHPTIEKLHALHLTGMARALEAQRHLPDMDTLSFEEHLGLLLDAESTERDNRRLQTRLRTAALRSTACLEDIDYRHHRGLDKSLMKKLATCQWLHERLNVLITGLSGIGKSWLACAQRVARASPPATCVYRTCSPSLPSPAGVVATTSSSHSSPASM
jgi:DNA replication protein DnaC